MRCKKCGDSIPDNHDKCLNCGRKVKNSERVTVTIPDSSRRINEYISSETGYDVQQGSSTIYNKDFTIENGILLKCSSSRRFVEIPYGVTEIIPEAFYGCALVQAITIPDSVMFIGDNAFYSNNLLKTIYCSEGSYAQMYAYQNGITSKQGSPRGMNLANKTIRILEMTMFIVVALSVFSIVFIDDKSDYDANNDYDVPHIQQPIPEPPIEEVVTEEVVEPKEEISLLLNIDDDEFLVEDGVLKKYRGIANVLEIPEGVTEISSTVFHQNASVREVILPNTLTTIGGWAFNDCYSLQTINIPDSVTNIEDEAFYGTPWYNGLNEEFNVVGDGVLIKYTGGSHYVTVPETVKHISGGAFGYHLQEITFPEGLRSIGEYAFYNTLLVNVVVPNGVTSIGEGAFKACSLLQNITMPDQLTDLGYWAFEECNSLQSIVIPEGVTEIRNLTFLGCNSLKEITLPASVVEIGNRVFTNCVSIETYYCVKDSYCYDYGMTYNMPVVVV